MPTDNRAKPYKRKEWQTVREEVMRLDHCECQRCAGNYKPDPSRPKRHRKAVLVHHNFELKKYPQWKYLIYVTLPDGQRVRNLVSLCNECHEEIHKDIRKRYKCDSTDFTNEERWD